MSNKLYPKIGQDESGKKFFFSSNWKHYTIRFSWRPMILIEQYFILYWWTKEVFIDLYNKLNNKERIDTSMWRYIPMLRKALDRLDELNLVLDLCSQSNKSPLVIYENDFNSFK